MSDSACLTAHGIRHDFDSEVFAVHGTQDPCVGDVAFALGRNSGQENAVCVAAVAGTLGANHGNIKAEHAWTGQLIGGPAVRRLTPRETERLQGFPDDYTMIPLRGKPAAECPDGPRYKAIGNSMAVPCMRWIGLRIQQYMSN